MEMEWKLQNPAGAGKRAPQAVGGNPYVKKGSSVFPAKRRSVKTMVFDSIVKFVSSLLCSNEADPMVFPSQPKIPKCNPNPNHDDKAWAPPVQSTGVFGTQQSCSV